MKQDNATVSLFQREGFRARPLAGPSVVPEMLCIGHGEQIVTVFCVPFGTPRKYSGHLMEEYRWGIHTKNRQQQW